jgi:hypothetical protein
VKRIDTSVAALQTVLDAWCAYKSSEISVDDDEEAYENLVEAVVLRAVSGDPEAFEDSENWWPRTFEEVGYTAPRMPLGDDPLYRYVRRDESGQWVLEHPGYEDDDED